MAGKRFTLNGRALPVAGAGQHDVLYRVVPVDPKHLRRGANEVRVLSAPPTTASKSSCPARPW